MGRGVRAVLSVHGLSVRYGRSVRALEDVHVEVPATACSRCWAATGPASRPCCARSRARWGCTAAPITAGEILFEGTRIDRLDPAKVVRAGVVAVPEGRQVFARMTVEENLRAGGLGARSAAARSGARARVHELFPVLARAGRAAGRAAVRRGAADAGHRPGADVRTRSCCCSTSRRSGWPRSWSARIARIIREIHAQGTAVVLVEQNATMALQVADHAVVLEVGRIALAGPAAELAASDEVQRLYLGGHAESQAQAESEAAEARAHRRTRTLSRWAG